MSVISEKRYKKIHFSLNCIGWSIVDNIALMKQIISKKEQYSFFESVHDSDDATVKSTGKISDESSQLLLESKKYGYRTWVNVYSKIISFKLFYILFLCLLPKWWSVVSEMCVYYIY